MDQNRSLVSVIVPVYNVQEYLKDCLDSIIMQSYEEIEVILVDDGSTDSSSSICREYEEKDARITVIRKDNGGLSDARNVGIDSCSGDYLTFIDSDDIVSKDYILDMYISAVRYDADIAQCLYSRRIQALDESIGKNKEIVLTGEEPFRRYLRMREPNVLACGKLFKSRLFEGVRFPVGRIDEDNFTTFIPVFFSKGFVQVNRVLYYYRDNPNSITNRRFSLDKFGILQSIEAIRDFLSDKPGDFDTELDYYALRHYVQLYNQAICMDGFADYSEELENVEEQIKKTKYSIPSNEMKNRVMVFMLLRNNRLYRRFVKKMR